MLQDVNPGFDDSDEREPMTDEELERVVREMEEEYYSELWQYVDLTHTNKDDAVVNANATSVYTPKYDEYTRFQGRDLPYVRLHSFCFAEFVRAIEHGATIKRLPEKFKYDDKKDDGPTTRYVVIDLDNDPDPKTGERPDLTANDLAPLSDYFYGIEPVKPPEATEDASDFLSIHWVAPPPPEYQPPKFAIVQSASQDPFKHHLIIKHPEPIRPEDYNSVYDDYSRQIQEVLGIKIVTDPKVKDWCHWFYGCSQDSERPLVIDERDVVTMQLTTKRLRVELRTPEEEKARAAQDEYYKKFRLVPDSMSKMLKEFGGTVANIPGFRAFLPWLGKGKTKEKNKIKEGKRYTVLSHYMLALYDFWRFYNYIAESNKREKLTEHNLLYTFDFRSRGSFDTGAKDFEKDLKKIKEALIKRIKANTAISDRDWLNNQFKEGKCAKRSNGEIKRVWRTKDHCREASRAIAERHGCTGGNTVATFASREILNAELEENFVKLPTFRNYMKKFGWSYKCETRKKPVKHKEHKTHRNAKFQYIIDRAVLVDGVPTYYRDKYVKGEAQFARRKRIAYVERKASKGHTNTSNL